MFVEFDPFSFSVKDFQTRTLLMRYNSSSDLYISTRQNTTILPPFAFAASSTKLWHSCLGHPWAPILNSFYRNKLFLCNKFQNVFFCHSYPLGKQMKLPFYNSFLFICMPFDILHDDLWTPPVLSFEGHRYYVLFLNDFTFFMNFSNLSQITSTFHFLEFRVNTKTQFECEIKCFQCDNNKEYDNSLFQKICELNGTLILLIY